VQDLAPDGIVAFSLSTNTRSTHPAQSAGIIIMPVIFSKKHYACW